MAKLNRESRLRERRLDKQARKDARKRAPAELPDTPGDILGAAASGETAVIGAEPPAVDAAVQSLTDA